MSGPQDPREIVIAEMRKQTDLLTDIHNLLVDVLDRMEGKTDTAAAPAVPDRMLDGPRGDPEVRQKDPRDWAGEPMKGRRFSECPQEYLDLLAERYDYFAGREDDEKKFGYNRLDAQRARGWAARKRAGWTAPVAAGRVDDTQGEPTW